MQDTAPPSPAVQAALDACAAAVLSARAAHADTLHAIAVLARTNAVAETGHRTLGRLLGEHLRLDPGDTRRLIRHAELLTPGEPSPVGPSEPVLPATADAVTDGALTPEHVTVIDKTVTRLRRVAPSLPPAVIDEAEHQLADLARHRTPGQTADAAHQILLRLDPDGEGPHDTDRPAEELRLHTGRDGTLTGRFRFAEPDAAEAMRSAIEARTPAPEPQSDTTILRPGRELYERRGEALRALVDDAGPAHDHDSQVGHSDTDGDDRLGLHPNDHDHDHEDSEDTDLADSEPMNDEPEADAGLGSPASPPRPTRDRPNRETTMIVTVGLDTLTGTTDRDAATGTRGWQGTTHPGFGLLDGRYALTPHTARRLACNAAIIPAVLGTNGEILDLGRKTRVVSTAQRRAVIARDRHCAHPGCQRSPRRCDVHHAIPWYLGGPSDLRNLVLLCPYHHHQQHHSGWQIHLRNNVPWFIPPTWLDPHQTPRTNRNAPVAA